MPKKVIIDVDPGIGGALGVVLAMLDPDLDVVAVTAAAGVVSGRDATRNVQGIIEQIDLPKWPRIGEAAELPMLSSPDEISHPKLLNGPTGLGDLEFPVAELHHRHSSAKLLIDLVRSEPGSITLVTLGPLTNVAAACERLPEFLSQLAGLVCLGGSISCGGDVTAAAEFNMYFDPESARTVLRSPATKTLVPIDVSRRAILTFEHFNRFPSERASPAARFLRRLLPYSFRAHHQYLGVEGIPLHQIVALAAVSRPSLFRTEPMAVDVETRGELCRGATVFDRRGIPGWQTNIEVVSDFDSQSVLDYVSDMLRHAAAKDEG